LARVRWQAVEKRFFDPFSCENPNDFDGHLFKTLLLNALSGRQGERLPGKTLPVDALELAEGRVKSLNMGHFLTVIKHGLYLLI